MQGAKIADERWEPLAGKLPKPLGLVRFLVQLAWLRWDGISSGRGGKGIAANNAYFEVNLFAISVGRPDNPLNPSSSHQPYGFRHGLIVNKTWLEMA